MTAEALDEVLVTLSENHASNLCFGVSVLVEMQGILSLSNDGSVGQRSNEFGDSEGTLGICQALFECLDMSSINHRFPCKL